ncbi:MAG: GIY-YIG nuclease family protein, partial [Campylobacterales bacterium]
IKQPCVYILTNKTNRVLYIGVTSDLSKRVYEHKNHLVKGFTSKYNVEKLVHYELYDDIEDAIKREKTLKGWKREKKNRLIEGVNPSYSDLYELVC